MMSFVAKHEIISSSVVGILELGTHEWLKRERRRNRPCIGPLLAAGPVLVVMVNEFSAKAVFNYAKGLEAFSRRHKNCCFSESVKCR
jgi:hypothetical protein